MKLTHKAVELVFLEDGENLIADGIIQVLYPNAWPMSNELELMDEPDEDEAEPKDENDFRETEEDQLRHD